LTEDAPFSLLPLFELGRLAGVQTPVMRSVLELCGLFLNEHSLRSGGTLKKMGLEGKNVSEIRDLLQG
jgi:opine dehydrogenase